jgi:imidazole glycerol-phosphate synthase subunit HisF
MLKVRVIPVLFLMNGHIVRSEFFKQFKIIGNPIGELARYSQWRADELVYVDITRDNEYLVHRTDHKDRIANDLISIVRQIADHASMPVTFGGRIFSLEQADGLIANGADKILVNTGAYRDPRLVRGIAQKYGSQAVVVGIDICRSDDRKISMVIDQGRESVSDDPVEYAKRQISEGAGEIFVNSIDRDGSARGYDIDCIRAIADAVEVPVVACGGVGHFSHFRAAISEGHASAVAAGNIFHFTENAYPNAKLSLKRQGINVRL